MMRSSICLHWLAWGKGIPSSASQTRENDATQLVNSIWKKCLKRETSDERCRRTDATIRLIFGNLIQMSQTKLQPKLEPPVHPGTPVRRPFAISKETRADAERPRTARWKSQRSFFKISTTSSENFVSIDRTVFSLATLELRVQSVQTSKLPTSAAGKRMRQSDSSSGIFSLSLHTKLYSAGIKTTWNGH